MANTVTDSTGYFFSVIKQDPKTIFVFQFGISMGEKHHNAMKKRLTKNKFDSKPQKPIIALSNFPHSARFRGQIAKVVLFSNECNNLLHAIFDKTMSTITTYKK